MKPNKTAPTESMNTRKESKSSTRNLTKKRKKL
jgi:hypothetical protein